MKHLWLMRHCEPKHGHPMDGTRPLTDDGRKNAHAMAEWFRENWGRVDIVITSPFARAAQTAHIMADELGSHVADTRCLEPDGVPEEAWAEIERLAQQSKDVLVVAHDPLINTLLMWILGLKAGVPEVRFEWGAIAHVRFKAKPEEGIKVENTLAWLVDPKLVLKEEHKELEEAALALTESFLPEDGASVNVSMRLVSDLEDGGALVQITGL